MNSKNEIEKLESRIAPLRKRINEICESEKEKVQLPKCRNLVGACLKSTYDDYTYAKILAFVEPKNKFYTFILEYIYVNKGGIASISLDDQHPYMNKEWWDEEIPMSGWVRIANREYELYRNYVMTELLSQTKLIKRIKQYK